MLVTVFRVFIIFLRGQRHPPTDLVQKLKTEQVENLSSRVGSVGCIVAMETGSRMPMGESQLPDTTQLDQLDSTCSVFNVSTNSVGSCRELVANSIRAADTTHRR